jgi:hypothetical protein
MTNVHMYQGAAPYFAYSLDSCILCRADAQCDSLHHKVFGALIHTVPLQHLVSRLQVPTAVALENELTQRRLHQPGLALSFHWTAAA